jgi:hypothetical protein
MAQWELPRRAGIKASEKRKIPISGKLRRALFMAVKIIHKFRTFAGI